MFGLVSVVIVAVIGIAAWVLAHRRAPVRTADTGEWVFANPDETASRTATAAARTAAKVAVSLSRSPQMKVW